MAPTVLVLDGVDALNSSGWTDSKVLERIANQLAKEMNANSGDRPVVVVATASRSENVPPILRATGRFSHELRLHLPTSSDRLAMFKMWLNAGCLRFPGDYSVLCKESEGLSGGEINDVCQRAFLQKARHVIEHVAEPPDEIPIQSDDVIKVLDRWKLTHRKDHPAS
jgi:transitional endoplasmic reticulum ATPase